MTHEIRIPIGYFRKALQISHTLFKNQITGAITENEYITILGRCVKRANKMYNELSKFFLIKNQQFLIQVTDGICSPHASPYDLLITFMKQYENKYCKDLTQSQYITDNRAPLLIGEMMNPVAAMLKLSFIMCANDYKFKTYAPDVSELVDFPAKVQHFSMEYYL